MMNIFELFQYPFMQRALAAGICLAALLGCLGVLVIMRRMAFFSDGIAHASLSGIALGVIFGIHPLFTALASSVLFAIGMFFLEKKLKLASDTVIGLIFTSGMAVGVLLIGMRPGYQPELFGFLFGNILSIRKIDLLVMGPCAVLFLAFFALRWRHFVLTATDPEAAHLARMNPDLYQVALYVILAASTVLASKMLGVILASALLIIPASISKLIACSLKKWMWGSIMISEVIMISGLAISAAFNLPAGATIVLVGTALFFLIAAAKIFTQKPLKS